MPARVRAGSGSGAGGTGGCYTTCTAAAPGPNLGGSQTSHRRLGTHSRGSKCGVDCRTDRVGGDGSTKRRKSRTHPWELAAQKLDNYLLKQLYELKLVSRHVHEFVYNCPGPHQNITPHCGYCREMMAALPQKDRHTGRVRDGMLKVTQSQWSFRLHGGGHSCSKHPSSGLFARRAHSLSKRTGSETTTRARPLLPSISSLSPLHWLCATIHC